MTPETPAEDEIEPVAGTEDEDGVIQPFVEETLDPDPEHAGDDDDVGISRKIDMSREPDVSNAPDVPREPGDTDLEAIERAQKEAAERQEEDGGGYE